MYWQILLHKANNMDSIDENKIYLGDSLDGIINKLKERMNQTNSVKLKKMIKYLESTKKN